MTTSPLSQSRSKSLFHRVYDAGFEVCFNLIHASASLKNHSIWKRSDGCPGSPISYATRQQSSVCSRRVVRLPISKTPELRLNAGDGSLMKHQEHRGYRFTLTLDRYALTLYFNPDRTPVRPRSRYKKADSRRRPRMRHSHRHSVCPVFRSVRTTRTCFGFEIMFLFPLFPMIITVVE